MSTAPTSSDIQRKPELPGQTVVVIDGSAGIGLETARRASAEGAKLILTGRNPLSSSAFDATDPALLAQFFRDLPTSIDHIMVTAGQPHYRPLIDVYFAHASTTLDEHLLLFIEVARNAVNKVRAGGTLIFMGVTGIRRPGIGVGIASTLAAALPSLTANLALELAPVRVNLIAAGFLDTGLSASLLGDKLENRRDQLRAELPIRRVVQASRCRRTSRTHHEQHCITGATYDVDGGQQFVEG